MYATVDELMSRGADVWDATKKSSKNVLLSACGGPGVLTNAYMANPIACAAARASLSLFDEESARRRAGIEEVHRGQVATLASHPSVKSPRVLGTLAAFDVGGAGVAGANSATPSAEAPGTS